MKKNQFMNGEWQQSFQQHKLQLVDITTRLADVIPDSSLTEALPAVRENLEQERFRLVVLGQFKRGKSTFINALLGESILPTDVIPLTAVITEIQHGDQPQAVVYFHEQQSCQAPLSELADYVTETGNPQNVKQVDRVTIQHPAAFLQRGVILVDTPGIGSIHEHNTRLTREYLLQADAAVFVFSADPPLTELEQDFLRLLIPIIPHVHFVLNKSDYLEADELEKVLAFNRTVLARLLPQAPDISPLSARNGLKARQNNTNGQLEQSGLPALEKQLTDFLMRHRGRYLILSNADRIIRICHEWKNLVELDRKARSLSIDELQANLEKFNHYIQTIRSSSRRLSFLLEEIKQRLLQYYDDQSIAFVRERESSIRDKIHRMIDARRQVSKRQLLPQIKSELLNVIIDEFEPYRLRLEKALKEKFNHDIHDLNHEVIQILNDIYRFSAELFHMSQAVQLQQNAWQYESQFYYKTWDPESSLDLLQNLIMMLLPRPLFVWLTKRQLNHAIMQKFDQQRGRFRADLFYGLSDNNRRFMFAFNQLIDRTADEISQLIEKHVVMKQQGEQDFQAIKALQDKQLEQVERIEHDLQTMKQFWEQAAGS